MVCQTERMRVSLRVYAPPHEDDGHSLTIGPTIPGTCIQHRYTPSNIHITVYWIAVPCDDDDVYHTRRTG